MNQIDYPADRIIAFLIAMDRGDAAAMRRFHHEEADLFRKMRAANRWVVCDAARTASPEAVQVLIELGAPINEQDSNGFAGLCWAVTRGRYDVAKLLLEAGPDPNLH